MAGRSFISRTFGKLKELFSGLTSGRSNPQENDAGRRSGKNDSDVQKKKQKTNLEVTPFDPRIDTQFVFSYSDALKREVDNMSREESESSATVMPATLTPTIPVLGFIDGTQQDIHSLISVFTTLTLSGMLLVSGVSIRFFPGK